MMFIEKISDEDKLTYIQKIAEQHNTGLQYDENFFQVECKPWERQEIQRHGYDQKMVELKKRNIYFSVFQKYALDSNKIMVERFSLITAFGDSAVKALLYVVDESAPLHENWADALAFIGRSGSQFDLGNKGIDFAYVKRFMLPHLQTLDKTQGTHLVADYQAALSNQFAKKRHLTIQTTEKQRGIGE